MEAARASSVRAPAGSLISWRSGAGAPADGVKIALRHREARYPMICLETALPVKFDATIVEALGEHAPRPAAFEGIEALPQRFEVMKPDAAQVQRFIEARA